jgi:uncharacterized repeat protein (TIGR04042 family)
MPEAVLHLRWPDAREARYYSPSSVICEHFSAGDSYEVAVFVARAREALGQASARVKAKYGFSCGRAAASIVAIEERAVAFAGLADARVEILEISL